MLDLMMRWSFAPELFWLTGDVGAVIYLSFKPDSNLGFHLRRQLSKLGATKTKGNQVDP